VRAKLSSLLAGLLTLALASCAAQREVQVVLLGGQSNMQGKGIYRELDRSLKKRLEDASKRVRVSTNGRVDQPLSYRSKERHVQEFGPELFVGLRMAEKFPDRHFLLIKTALSGTSLHGAWSPEWQEEKAKGYEFGKERQQRKLYREHLVSINAQLQKLRWAGHRYRLVGMVWMQGESDTRHEIPAASYEVNLRNLILAYRKDLGQADLAFVFGQVNSPFQGEKSFPGGLEVVRKAMLDVTRSVAHTTMIPTSMNPEWPDFPKHSDDVHYDTEGQKRLGTAFAEALINAGN